MANLLEQLPPARPTARNRSWIRVDDSGNSQVIEVDKLTMMRRCELFHRDLRLLDPLFVYPSTILPREKAIVVNLEQIRCIIKADEVFLLNSEDSNVSKYVEELQRRLTTVEAGEGFLQRELGKRGGGNRFSNMYYDDNSTDNLPFEFKALQIALEIACTYLYTKVRELETEAYPLLDELTTRVSNSNLNGLRQLKSTLIAWKRKVQKVKDEIEQLLDDDGDIAEMYLTEKKSRMESASSLHGDQFMSGYRSNDVTRSVSAHISPVSLPPDKRLKKRFSLAKSRNESKRSESENTFELEMMLEAYFVITDDTLNKLTTMSEYIDDTEDYLKINLDTERNKLIMFEVLLATASFIVALFGVLVDFETYMYQFSKFRRILISTGIIGFVIFFSSLWFFRYITKPLWMK